MIHHLNHFLTEEIVTKSLPGKGGNLFTRGVKLGALLPEIHALVHG
jgi:hypothetical protein